MHSIKNMQATLYSFVQVMMFKILIAVFALLSVFALVNGALVAAVWAGFWTVFCAFADKHFAQQQQTEFES